MYPQLPLEANGIENGGPVILNQPNSIGADPNANDDSVGVIQQYPPLSSGKGTTHLTPLAASDRVLVKQRRELLEVVLGCETENKYEIFDEQNEIMYTVDETSEFCMRCWCGPLRPIYVNIRDRDGNLVIFLKRPLACQEICFPCCLQKMTIESPPGNRIGLIEQKWGIRPELLVKDSNDSIVFIVKGPLCQFSCRCGDVDFPIFASDGISECGKVSKQWRGILTEAFTDADIFGVQFPPGINASMKALLLGATFLIDYMYFESTSEAKF